MLFLARQIAEHTFDRCNLRKTRKPAQYKWKQASNWNTFKSWIVIHITWLIVTSTFHLEAWVKARKASCFKQKKIRNNIGVDMKVNVHETTWQRLALLSTIIGISKLLFYFSRISTSASDLTISQIQHYKFPFRVKRLIGIDLPLQKIVQKRKRQKNQDKRIYSWVLHSSSNKLLTKEKLSSFTTKYLKLPTHTLHLILIEAK